MYLQNSKFRMLGLTQLRINLKKNLFNSEIYYTGIVYMQRYKLLYQQVVAMQKNMETSVT